jgi:hypothetical protein
MRELECQIATLESSHQRLKHEHSLLCASHAELVATAKTLAPEKQELLANQGDEEEINKNTGEDLMPLDGCSTIDDNATSTSGIQARTSNKVVVQVSVYKQ